MPTHSPSYRYHKARNCAVVRILGRDHYLGAFESPESYEKYHRLIAEHLANRKLPAPPQSVEKPLTVTELILRYWRYAKSWYVKNGQPTSEQAVIRAAMKFLRQHYGSLHAGELSPKKLKAIQEAMIAHGSLNQTTTESPNNNLISTKCHPQRMSLSRTCINKYVDRIKRLYAWAVQEELVSVEVYQALRCVQGLHRGKSAARETQPVQPVSLEDIDAILPHLPPTIAVMIQVQHLMGARPQDVVQMREQDIDQSGNLWVYRPRSYKTEHHQTSSNDHNRVLFIGQRCQQLLAPYISAAQGGSLFSPKRSEALRRSPDRLQIALPTIENTARKLSSRGPQDEYTVTSYRRAIQRACEKAGISVWSPNQLRHTRLTEIRRQFGLEASRVVAGHGEVTTTQIYAEQDQELAKKVMREIG